MKEPNKNPCSVRIYAGTLSGHTCGRPGKVKVKGQWYCGVHDPIREAARLKARDEKWTKERETKEAWWDWNEKHKKAQDEVVRTARAVAAGPSIPPTTEESAKTMHQTLVDLKLAVAILDQVEKEKPQ